MNNDSESILSAVLSSQIKILATLKMINNKQVELDDRLSKFEQNSIDKKTLTTQLKDLASRKDFDVFAQNLSLLTETVQRLSKLQSDSIDNTAEIYHQLSEKIDNFDAASSVDVIKGLTDKLSQVNNNMLKINKNMSNVDKSVGNMEETTATFTDTLAQANARINTMNLRMFANMNNDSKDNLSLDQAVRLLKENTDEDKQQVEEKSNNKQSENNDNVAKDEEHSNIEKNVKIKNKPVETLTKNEVADIVNSDNSQEKEDKVSTKAIVFGSEYADDTKDDLSNLSIPELTKTMLEMTNDDLESETNFNDEEDK